MSARTCSTPGCDAAHVARGLCSLHYRRMKASGRGGCRWAGCGNRSQVRGYCQRHDREVTGTSKGACSVGTCDREVRTAGYCNAHYQRVRSGRTLDAPIRPFAPGEWGKWTRNGQGYIQRERVTESGREYQSQHSFIMSRSLGRELLPHEEVHHKNGDRSDNRIENLELWSTSQPAGQRVADKVAWAREILTLYGKEGVL